MKTPILLLLIAILLTCENVFSQELLTGHTKPFYTDTSVCYHYETYKGKKNHGEKYCVSWVYLREHYPSGKIDTTGFSFTGKSFFGDEYELYEGLSERNKFIYDSLREYGHIWMGSNYIDYEPQFMKPGFKKEWFYEIRNNSIIVCQYWIYKTREQWGSQLLQEKVIK